MLTSSTAAIPDPIAAVENRFSGICPQDLKLLVLFAAIFQNSGSVRNSNAVVLNPGEDGAPRFGRQPLWRKYSRQFSRKKLDE